MSVNLEINAGRLLYGLSRIGYTTSAAICDIIDNSIRAKAANIHILIQKERKDLADSRRNNVSQYLIIDDGHGMDDDGIKDALTLGSSNSDYEEHSLSKFGLGLKSAAFSQGDLLTIVSSNGESDFNKYQISLPEVMESGTYAATKMELDNVDNELIAEYLPDQRGTIITLGNIRKNNHPSVRNTVKELNTKIGVIYYYFIHENNVNIHLSNNHIEAIDPLFLSEANENGNLNENEWEGLDVRWIEKPQEILLDNDLNISATIEITQMPYPPIFRIKNLGEAKDREIREKYLIEAANYGFYVYRNKRLISWASHLQIIPYDQDYYAFRGRILIDDTADDFFNIDVKKSTITLSEEAWSTISDFTKEAKSKTKAAWLNAGRLRKDIINKDTNEIANKLLEEFEQIEILPGDVLPTEELALSRIASIRQDMADKVRVIVRMMKEDKGEDVDEGFEITDEEKEEAVKGEINPDLSKIFRVTSVQDNLLWEPYYDTDIGNSVRINKFHRFARFIYEDNSENQDLQIIFDLLMLQMADAEFYAYKNIGDYEYEELKKILYEFRRITSEFLANMCRRLEDQLPPNYSGSEL